MKKNTGVSHLARDQWLENISEISKSLFAQSNKQLIPKEDEIYCYIQRSSNK